MKYAYVENEQVKDIRQTLPTVWNNISNFNTLDDNTVKAFGWLPYTFIEGQSGDDYIILGSNFEILENEVIEHQITRLKTDEEKEKKTPRNEPCPCGSGKKFKQCCGRSGPKKGILA